MYKHLERKQKVQQKVHNNYVALLMKQFVFTKLWNLSTNNYLVNIYLFKCNNRSTRKKCGKSSKVTIKTA